MRWGTLRALAALQADAAAPNTDPDAQPDLRKLRVTHEQRLQTGAAAPRNNVHDPGMCQLGFGLPNALALKALHPERPVLQITGDGSFGFTLPELDTARRHQLPVVSIVHNNAAWGVIRAGQKAQAQFEFGTSLAGTDYAAIARGFGCHGERVETVDALAPALSRALASGLPAVLDCRTRWVPHPCMPLFGAMNRYGQEVGG